MRSREDKHLLSAAGVSLLLAFSSCARLHVWKLDRAVSSAVERLHEHLKASRFEEIYAEASPHLRAAVTEEEFVKKLREVRARLGDIADIKEPPPLERLEAKEYDWIVTVFDIDGAGEDGRELMAWEVSEAGAKLQRYSFLFNEGKESIDLEP
jgi:hypothetical protein